MLRERRPAEIVLTTTPRSRLLTLTDFFFILSLFFFDRLAMLPSLEDSTSVSIFSMPTTFVLVYFPWRMTLLGELGDDPNSSLSVLSVGLLTASGLSYCSWQSELSRNVCSYLPWSVSWDSLTLLSSPSLLSATIFLPPSFEGN